MRRQRLSGLALLLAGLASILPTGDATAALLLVPLGLWMLASRRYLLYPAQKKSAPAAATADAQPQRGVHQDTSSIAQSGGKGK